MAEYRYPGIKSFTETQKDIFWGRETDIENILVGIKIDPLVLMYGKSGIGKTSLLEAGVIPRLKEYGYKVFSMNFAKYFIEQNKVSESDNLQIINSSIISELRKSHNDKKCYLDELIEEDNSLWFHIKKLQALNGENEKFVFVFDQFEDLLTFPQAAINNFKNQISELLYSEVPPRFIEAFDKKNTAGINQTLKYQQLWQKPQVNLILSVRADRLNQINKLNDYLPGLFNNTLELQGLTLQQAERALVKPAILENERFTAPIYEYSTEAIEEILAYLIQNKENRINPFQFQIVCRHIEELVIQNHIPVIKTTHIKSLPKILDSFYTDILQQFQNTELRRNIRLLIEEELIYEEEGVRLSIYEGILLKRFTKQQLHTLTELQLLQRVTNYKGNTFYEVTNDSLIQPILKAKHRRHTEETLERQKEVDKQRIIELRKIHRNRFIKMTQVFGVVVLLISVSFSVALMKKNKLLEERAERADLKSFVLIVENNVNRNFIEIAAPKFTDNEVKKFIEIAKIDYDSCFMNGNYRKATSILDNYIAIYKKIEVDSSILAEALSDLAFISLFANQQKKAYGFANRAFEQDNTSMQVKKNLVLTSWYYNKHEETEMLFDFIKTKKMNNVPIIEVLNSDIEKLESAGIVLEINPLEEELTNAAL